MKILPVCASILALLFTLSGCKQTAGNAPSLAGAPTSTVAAISEQYPAGSPGPISTPKLELVPIVIGGAPSNDSNSLVGTWQATSFSIRSDGSISGRLEISLDRDIDFRDYQDVLIIQISAYYIYLPYGDFISKPAGDFIPVKASQSANHAASFDIAEKFPIPPLILDIDGGLPLHHLQVSMTWYRATRPNEDGYSGYNARIASPENFGAQPWMGMPIFDRTVSLQGKIDSNAGGNVDFSEWFAANSTLPTNTPPPPGAYPVLPSTPSPAPQKPYP